MRLTAGNAEHGRTALGADVRVGATDPSGEHLDQRGPRGRMRTI